MLPDIVQTCRAARGSVRLLNWVHHAFCGPHYYLSRLDFSLQFGFMRDQLLFGSISFLFNVPNSGVHFIIYVIIIHSNAPGKDQVLNYASMATIA